MECLHKCIPQVYSSRWSFMKMSSAALCRVLWNILSKKVQLAPSTKNTQPNHVFCCSRPVVSEQFKKAANGIKGNPYPLSVTHSWIRICWFLFVAKTRMLLWQPHSHETNYSPAQWCPCSCILHGGLGRSNPQKPGERRETCSMLHITMEILV